MKQTKKPPPPQQTVSTPVPTASRFGPSLFRGGANAVKVSVTGRLLPLTEPHANEGETLPMSSSTAFYIFFIFYFFILKPMETLISFSIEGETLRCLYQVKERHTDVGFLFRH